LAYEYGILPDDLKTLIDLITVPNHLDQASLAVLVKSLYPAGKVAAGIVLDVVGSLGHGQLKPSLGIQALLLRWLILTYHILESPAILSQIYPVLFNLLGTAGLRCVCIFQPGQDN
jgi:centromere protein I